MEPPRSVASVAIARPPLVSATHRPRRRRTPKTTTSAQRVQAKLSTLTLALQSLHHEMDVLHNYRSLLYARAVASQDDAILNKVLEYYNVFRDGYEVGDRRPVALLDAIADKDLSLGTTGFGRDMVLEQWRRYTQYFAIHCLAPRLVLLPRPLMGKENKHEQDATTTVRVELSFHGTLTPAALTLVFPAVLHDASLTQQLLGKPFRADTVCHLYFNQAGLLVRHEVETDFFAVLATALGDSKRAAEIMESVDVAEESMLADPDDDDEENEVHVSLEPVERVVRSKRLRFAAVDENKDSEDHVEDEGKEDYYQGECGRGCEEARDTVVTETEAEPVGRDVRHTVAFLLS